MADSESKNSDTPTDEGQAEVDTAPNNAGPPFDDPDADAILRSADNVDFRVFKGILSVASPFFKTMFTLPNQPSDNKGAGDTSIISVTEESTTLRVLLQYCYPTERPKVSDFDVTWKVLEASKKYDLEFAEKIFLQHFKDHFASAPLRCFAVAARHRWTTEVHMCAKLLLQLQLPFGECIKELEYVRASIFHQLIRYHTSCGTAAIQALSFPSSVKAALDGGAASVYCFFSCRNPESIGSPTAESIEDDRKIKTLYPHYIGVPDAVRYIPHWFRHFLGRYQREVGARPSPHLDPVKKFAPIIDEAIKSASFCSHCEPRVRKDLPLFIKKELVPLVAAAVEAVPLEFKL